MINQKYVAEQICYYRKRKKMTQAELAECLNMTPQAVSKWERGECLPDTSILLDLANALETSVDTLLNGGRIIMEYTDRINVAEIVDAIDCFKIMHKGLGKEHFIYRTIMDALNEKMNSDVEEIILDDSKIEVMYTEAIVQKLEAGSYIDLNEMKRFIKSEHFQKVITDYAREHGITC